MMDSGPLWSQDNQGNYCLLFPNKNALSKQEICKIFSNYGEVKQINAAGDERGFRFVQYGSLNDVERAVNGLKNHPFIKLLPYRQKNQVSNNKEQNSSMNFNEEVNNNRNYFKRETVNTTTDNSDKRSNSRASSSNFKSNSSVCSDISLYSNNNSINSSNQNLSKSILTVSAPDYSVSHQPTNTAENLLKFKQFNTSYCSSNDTVNNVYDDDIPDLVTKQNIPQHSQGQKKIILKAEVVVVANIHENYGPAYMLHLFEKFSPLAVSYMYTVPESETKYCYVYFKSVEDSKSVETLYDKYNLAGKNLIVLRTCKLIEEANEII